MKTEQNHYPETLVSEPNGVALYLKEYFLECSRKNSQFSLRAFAKKLGITPSGLSQVLSGKKKLSLDRAHEFTEKLSLSAYDAEYFILLAQVHSAKKPLIKAQLTEKIQTLFPERKAVHSLTIDQFKMISEWYGMPVLETVCEIGPSWTAEQIATFLNISKNEVELMLMRLERLELIEKVNGRYERVENRILVESAIPSEAIRNFYHNCLPQIKDSIENQTPTEKVIGAEHFAFDPDQIDEVRIATNQYLDRLAIIAAKGKNKTQIYQAFVDVYRLNENPNQMKKKK